jgi:hypothetical protein
MKAQLDQINAQHESIAIPHADLLSELARKTQDQQHWQERFQTLQAPIKTHLYQSVLIK